MADKAPEQEPSIEEILASIRQIISEDDQDAAEESAATSAVEETAEPEAPEEPETVVTTPEPEPEPIPEPETAEEEDGGDEDEEEVLELTDPIMEQPEDDADPIEVDLQDIEEEEEPVMAEPEEPRAESPILNESARKAAVASMARLAGNMPINRPSHTHGSITLEDLVREMLNPMLSDWLNENLPPMVERIVQKELEKLARQALDE